MDYQTNPTSRDAVRLYSKLFRTICGYTYDEPIDPIQLLDRLPDLEGFNDVTYSVIYDFELSRNVPAQCLKTEDGYVIQIKESVYNGAYLKKTGGYRMHIMHEIMHPFADKLGFVPILSRSLSINKPAYCSLEWVVKALAGEVMMPYEATRDMTVEQIMSRYGVSEQAAKIRLTY